MLDELPDVDQLQDSGEKLLIWSGGLNGQRSAATIMKSCGKRWESYPIDYCPLSAAGRSAWKR